MACSAKEGVGLKEGNSLNILMYPILNVYLFSVNIVRFIGMEWLVETVNSAGGSAGAKK